MPSEEQRELMTYRVAKAEKTLDVAIKLSQNISDEEDYATILNRTYYAIFHCMRAVLASTGFDSKKHSGIIAHFNQHYVKTEIFPKHFYKIISAAADLRNNSDYMDYAYFEQEEVDEQIENAQVFLTFTKSYISGL